MSEGRRCRICWKVGHNARTCPKRDELPDPGVGARKKTGPMVKKVALACPCGNPATRCRNCALEVKRVSFWRSHKTPTQPAVVVRAAIVVSICGTEIELASPLVPEGSDEAGALEFLECGYLNKTRGPNPS